MEYNINNENDVNNKYVIYELKKIKCLSFLIMLFILLFVLCICSYFNLQSLMEHLGNLIIPAVILLNIVPVVLITYIILGYNKYEKVMVSSETRTVCFVKNNSIEKVFSFDCIVREEYRRNSLSLTSHTGDEVRLVMKNQDALELFNYLQPYVEKNVSKVYKVSIKETFALLVSAVILIVLCSMIFSVMTCDCRRETGFCTLKSYTFFTPYEHVFDIKDILDVKVLYKRAGRYGHNEINIDINNNGAVYTINPEIYFYEPFVADYFSDRFNKFLNSSDTDFSYNYVSPVLLLIIFVVIWGIFIVVIPQKALEKYIILLGVIVSVAIYSGICANISLNFDSGKAGEKTFVSYYSQAVDFLLEKKINDALELLKKSEQIYKDDYLVALKISDIYLDKKDYKNALFYAEKSIALIDSGKESIIAKNISYTDDSFDAKVKALNYAAVSFRKTGDCKNAVVYYTKLLDTVIIPENYASVRLNRGKCYLKLGEKEKALNDFLKYRDIVKRSLKENSFKYSIKNLVEAEKLIDFIDKNAVKKQKTENMQISKVLFADMEKIKINPPSEYDNLTQKEIFDLRQKYVKESKFASIFYKPDKEVFGGIHDKTPWYGLDNVACPFGKDVASGPSARSIYINNPSLLLGVINHLGYHYPKNAPFCKNKLLQFIPEALYFDKNHNMIIAVYKADKSLIKNIQQPEFMMPFSFVGLNARDFGYEYVYVYEKYNLYFTKKDNVSQSVYKLSDYIHLGTSCKLDGGCNNTSPMQPKLEFGITALPAGVTFKLWKRQPLYNTQGADIYFKAIFEE